MSKKNVSIDMWYGDNYEEADKIDIFFYPGDGYRGNIYKDGKAIGDYAVSDSVLLEKLFPQLTLNWR